MKFFLDTANLDEIQFGVDTGLLDGVTTNPTLISREGKAHEAQLRAIAEIVSGPISAEVTATETDGMVAEGRRLHAIADNVVVKVPIGMDGLRATRALSGEGIRVNVTLVFSPLQALMAAKAGAAYVSPFVGRLDDVGHEGMDGVGQIIQIFAGYDFDCEVLVASVRHPIHVLQAALLGADVATMPRNVLEQMVKHPLTDSGLAKFLADAGKTPR